MYAVILTGGKQYRVKEGDVLSVEKLNIEPGRKAQFDRVLLIEDGDDILVGTPVLDNAMVLALVLENYKDEKVLVFKKKRRKQYRRTRGHRQPLTKIRIARITADRTLITAADLAEEKLVTVENAVQTAQPKASPPAQTQGQGPKERGRQAENRQEAGRPQKEESDQGVSHGS